MITLISDIKLVVGIDSVVCNITFGWDYCSEHGDITVRLLGPKTINVENNNGVYEADLSPGMYVCSVAVFNPSMPFNSTPVGYHKKSELN